MARRARRLVILTVSAPLVALAALGYADNLADLGKLSRELPGQVYDLLWPRETKAFYETTKATLGSIHRVVATSGSVRPWVTVQIGSQLSGQVSRVLVDFNSEVKAGEILAELDATMFEAKVEQAEADLAMAKAVLLNQQAALKKAEAVLAQAEQARLRQQALADKGVATQANLEAAIRDTNVAHAEITIGEAQIENARANVLQREAALKQARIDLERTRIRSPIDGVVVSRTVDIGQTVAASLQAPELFRIAQDLRSIRIEAQVNEADIGTVADGNPATFTVDSYPGQVFEGKVTQVRLAPIELSNVVTYAVLIEARNDDLKLFPGMTANVRIETARRERVLRVPAAALRFKPRNIREREQTADKASRQDRQVRQIEKMKQLLVLTDDQVRSVTAELTARSHRRAVEADETGDGNTPDPGVQAKSAGNSHSRSAERMEQALLAVMTAEQQRVFEAWKKKREATRPGVIWVLDAGGDPEMRSVRLGLSDARYAEVSSGSLKVGEQIIVATRKARSK